MSFRFDAAAATGERRALEGKVAIVTGASNGIGRAAVDLFRRAGAHVVATDIVPGDDLVEADVTQDGDVRRLVATALERHGAVDVVYNNAGVGTIRETPAPVHETEDWVWERTIDVNLRGTFLVCRAVLPHMVGRGGSIVNVSSVYGLVAGPEAPSYSASKSGVIGLTRAIAVDYAAHGVRANVICPGFIATAMVLGYVEKLPDPATARAEIDAAHLAGRLGEPEEVAAAALWLASDASSFVTGAVIPVDGGYTTR